MLLADTIVASKGGIQMSDTSQSGGWWEASDGKWYSPETHPNYRPPPPIPQAVPSFESGVVSDATVSPKPAAVLSQHKQGWLGEHGFPFSLRPLPIVTGIVVALMAVGGIAFATSGSGAPSSSSTSATSQAATAPPVTAPPTTTPLNFNVGPTTPPPVTAPPVTAPNPRIAQQAAIAQDQATVASDQALVAQDISAIQTLTTQQQNDNAAISIGRAGAQQQIQGLQNSGQSINSPLTPGSPTTYENLPGSPVTYPNLSGVSASQRAAAAQASSNDLAATVAALSAAEAKLPQDEASLATAKVALQVAEDVASSQQ